MSAEPVTARETANPAPGSGFTGSTDDQEVLLEINSLSKNFGGLQAISDVSLNLRAGIITTLVGPNGAGKTTLFNMITGHIQPSQGDVRWQGESLIGKAPWRIARKGIARTFQDLRLFTHMTVEENILTMMEPGSWLWQPGGKSRKARRYSKVSQIMDRTGLTAKRHTRALDLAYAERKFLSLARIMATDSRLWLLDEPASGLDPNSYNLFLQLLREEVKEGITVCIIEHNLDIVVNISDRIAFLDQGRLLADGEPETILNDPALAAIYFGER
ncbi:ABC transporter ATP-binding protein [Marinobacter salicampi]|uniref:ABC transporter ATP-binding protein n=1 Tax=Marinobacter salicampi TaxID=435907 RepID=UPI00140E5B5D|nr:ABC transporter ATP-binding protein [Marinobacter salicampi]